MTRLRCGDICNYHAVANVGTAESDDERVGSRSAFDEVTERSVARCLFTLTIHVDFCCGLLLHNLAAEYLLQQVVQPKSDSNML